MKVCVGGKIINSLRTEYTSVLNVTRLLFPVINFFFSRWKRSAAVVVFQDLNNVWRSTHLFWQANFQSLSSNQSFFEARSMTFPLVLQNTWQMWLIEPDRRYLPRQRNTLIECIRCVYRIYMNLIFYCSILFVYIYLSLLFFFIVLCDINLPILCIPSCMLITIQLHSLHYLWPYHRKNIFFRYRQRKNICISLLYWFKLNLPLMY